MGPYREKIHRAWNLGYVARLVEGNFTRVKEKI